jgi:hypothetical protein
MLGRKTACAVAITLSAISVPAFAQTATAFNLTCTPQSHSIQGTNTFGAPLTLEDYQGVVEETVEVAVDLTAKTACHPRYCTPEQWRTAVPIVSTSEKEIVFDDIAARVVETNEYNVMSYRRAYQPAARILITSFGFFDEAGKVRTGSIELVKSCTKTAFALSKE